MILRFIKLSPTFPLWILCFIAYCIFKSFEQIEKYSYVLVGRYIDWLNK